MPAYGLIPDSPLIYGGQKYLNSLSKAAARSATFGKAPIGMNLTLSKVIIYKPVLNRELHLQGGVLWGYMDRLGSRIVASAKKQVGVKTGVLRESIHKRHLGNASGQYLWIGSNRNYAYMHHEGTRPHIITPKEPGGVLVFSKGARVITTKLVLHPGTKANRFLSDQLRVHIRR
jgi:hypothetical protein